MNTWIYLPGLGADPYMLKRIAFSFTLFGKEITVAWYGILIVIGIISAFIYASWRAKRVGINLDTMVDYTLFTVIAGVICARLYYIVFYADGHYDSFYDVIAIWNGGLAIYGGIIGGGLTVFIISRIKKNNFFAMADFIAPAVMLAQSIGRWGNFVNGEAHGTVTSLPWRMGVISTYATEAPDVSSFLCYHPTFLYESLWNVIGFILINVFYKKHRFNGEVFAWYVAWYGFGRGFIELLRTDSLMLGSFRVSSLLGFVSFAVALTAIIVVPIVMKKKSAETAASGDGSEKTASEGENAGDPAAAENAAESADTSDAGAENAAEGKDGEGKDESGE